MLPIHYMKHYLSLKPKFWPKMNSRILNYPPVSEVSREEANLAWRKNIHPPVYGVKEFVCLSVAKFDLNFLRTGKIDVMVLYHVFVCTQKKSGK